VYRTGHLGTSLLLYAPVGYVLLGSRPLLAVLGGVAVVALASLPDIDHQLPGIEHRGLTHSLLFVAGIGAVGWLAGTFLAGLGAGGTVSLAGVTLGVAGFGGFVGAYAILAHLAGDIITPAGVPLFWPLPTNVSLSLVGADNTVANYGLLGAGVVATAGVLAAAGPV
jgi:inner membrane protein